MAIADDFHPSNVTPFRVGPLTASADISRKDNVIVLNPGTTGTYNEGADTASAVFCGIATDDASDAAGDTDVPIDCGGAIVARTFTSVADADEGRAVFVAGPDSVAASGNVRMGRVIKKLGTNRALIKCDVFGGQAGATGPTGPTGSGG